MLHAAPIQAELLRRLPDNSWPEQPELIENGALALNSIGFSAPIAELYRTTRLV